MGNRNRKQAHAYNTDEIERLRGLLLPAKLKCNTCLRDYNAANFSEKQKMDARYQISKQGRVSTNPKCLKCTGDQLVEIECSYCHKIKGLEDFAKVQRRKPDDAQCYTCTDVQLSREAVEQHADRYDVLSKAFIDTTSSSGRFPDYFSSTNSAHDTESSNGDWTETSSTDTTGGRRKQEEGGISLSNQFQQAMSVSGEVSDTLIDSEYFYKPVDDTKSGSWSEVAGTKSWHTGAVIASSSRSITTNGYGRLPGSVRSFNSSFAERSHSASGQIEMRNGFAKVTACKPTPQLEQDANFSGDENSSSDNDDDDNDDDTSEGEI